MSRLDNISPSSPDGLYDVEIQVEGEWIVKALLSKKAIYKLAAYIDKLQEDDL